MSMADDLQNLLDREEAPLDAIVDLMATHFFEKILTEVNTSRFLLFRTHGFVAPDDASHRGQGQLMEDQEPDLPEAEN